MLSQNKQLCKPWCNLENPNLMEVCLQQWLPHNPTHVLFHELSKPFSCDSKPSASKSYEFRSNGLYRAFENGLQKSLLMMANIFVSFFAKYAPSHLLTWDALQV